MAFGAIGEFISGLFSPAASLIDNLHTSEEEKGKIRAEIAKIQASVLNKTADLEMKRLDAISKVQSAEANSSHVITATWRPICSMALVFIVILASFGVIPKPDSDFYDLVKVFIGIYGGGRSLEKIGSVLKLGK
ncbi:MAG: hypothetical protein KAQ85_01385 [Thermodesulfovibrionia bacterium]|nr:hypothetical protein [Thermodesulfovibrionia bacterium]